MEDHADEMSLLHMKLPRQLEDDGTANTILQVLAARSVQLWPGSDLSVPVIAMSDPLKMALRRAISKGRICCGLEEISDRLEKEKRGVTRLLESRGLPPGDRIARLILCSNDGARRFYRAIEHLLQLHAPKLLGAILDIDSIALGSLIFGKERQVKIIMADHKETVSEILRTLLADGPDETAHRRTP